MHNKLLIADGGRAIVGGRNVADAHHGLHRANNLVDCDVLLTGSGVAGLQGAFASYWDNEPATPASALDRSLSHADLDAVRTLVAEQVTERADAFPPDLATDTTWRDRVAAGTLPVPAETLHITSDVPGPAADTRPTQVVEALHEAVASARNELVVVAPFFVPSEIDVGYHGQLVDRGVRIRLLTNLARLEQRHDLHQWARSSPERGGRSRGRALRAASRRADKPQWETPPNVATDR